MIQVEGGQNKTDSPLRAMEHGILESELGEEKKKKKEICIEILSLRPSEKSHSLSHHLILCPVRWVEKMIPMCHLDLSFCDIYEKDNSTDSER